MKKDCLILGDIHRARLKLLMAILFIFIRHLDNLQCLLKPIRHTQSMETQYTDKAQLQAAKPLTYPVSPTLKWITWDL